MKIELQNVSKIFDKTKVLQNVNLELQSGKIYGLIGRNGCGKSVLLKMICGFYEPSDGVILFDSENIIREKKFPPKTRALIEKPHFLPDLTGLENLKLLASIQKKIGEKEILDTLKLVNLYEERNKKYHKYSLGMKQKLGIAQVLMEDPDVIVLDEPFNGLDEDSISKIRNVLKEEKKRGKLILLATHLREDIDSLCDEVYSLNGGTLKKI